MGDKFSPVRGNKPWFDDIKAPLIGQRIDQTAGHIDYNYTDLTVDIDDSAGLTDIIGFLLQMNHSKVLDDPVDPHVHWLQSSANIPNMMKIM